METLDISKDVSDGLARELHGQLFYAEEALRQGIEFAEARLATEGMGELVAILRAGITRERIGELMEMHRIAAEFDLDAVPTPPEPTAEQDGSAKTCPFCGVALPSDSTCDCAT